MIIDRRVIASSYRFNSKKYQRDTSLIAFICFLYTLLVLKRILPRRVTDILQCSLPETGYGMAVVNFYVFSVAVYCILVVCQKKLSMPRMTL